MLILIRSRVFALIAAISVLAFTAAPLAQTPKPVPWIDAYREPAARLVGEAMSSPFAWERLALIGDTFGNRLSGSQSLEDAIQWAVREMKKDGLDNVHTEPVKVPHWVRGQESIEITAPRQYPMVMLGLGNSVGTPPEGIEAEVLVVRSFEELDAAGARVKGRIVLFNVPFTNYGETVQFRAGAVPRGGARGGRGPRPLRRAGGPAPSAHRGAALRGRRPADSRGRAHQRGRGSPPAHAGSRHARPRPPEDGGEVSPRRRLLQRRRRAAWPRSAGRGRPRQRALRFMGRGHGIDGRWRRVRRVVGGAAHHEEAEPAPAPHRARGALDERRERHARRPRLS